MSWTRVRVNLVAFAVLSALLGWWLWSNAVTFGLDAPDHLRVVVELEASPGLRPGIEVAYLGHAVGQVLEEELTDDRVLVTVGVDPEAPLPAALTAEVRRRSALGEPYIELAPRPDVPGEARPLADGERIELTYTSLPVSYQEVFTSLAGLVDRFPVDDVGTIVTELATALDGREQEVRDLLADSDALLATFAERADLLDRLAVESTAAVGWFADAAPGLAGSVDDLATIVAELRDARDPLLELLDTSPDLFERTAALVLASRDDLGCLLGSLETSLETIDTPANADRLAEALERGPAVREMLRDVTHVHESGPWLRVDMIFNSGDRPITQYAEPLPHPREQPDVACAAVPGSERYGGADAERASAGATSTAASDLRADDTDVDDEGTPPDEVTADPPAGEVPTGGRWFVWVAMILAALGLAGLTALVASGRR